MTKQVKADLSLHPHFFSPGDAKRVPHISDIVDGLFDSDVDIMALGSCHTTTSGMDHRFESYLAEVERLAGWGYSWDLDEKNGVLKVTRELDSTEKYIVHTQKVRAYDGDAPAHLNILGVGGLVEPARDIRKTAEEARADGGVVIVSNPNTKFCASLDTAVALVDEGLAHGVDISAYNSPNHNSSVLRRLHEKGIKGLAVTGGHNYRLAGTSYSQFDESVVDRGFLDLDLLSWDIQGGNFKPTYGYIGAWDKFMTRDRHIYASIPGHLLAGGARAKELIAGLFGKRK